MQPIVTLTPVHENGQTVFVDPAGQSFRLLSGLGNIQASSKPDTPTDWTCTDWLLWHKELVKVHGRDKANDMFAQAFEKQGIFDKQFNFCKYDCDWANYFKSQGLDAGHFLSNVFCKSAEVIDNVADAAGDVSGGASDVAKTLKTFLPVLLAVVAIGGGVFVYKNFIKGNKSLNIGPLKLG